MITQIYKKVLTSYHLRGYNLHSTPVVDVSLRHLTEKKYHENNI